MFQVRGKTDDCVSDGESDMTEGLSWMRANDSYHTKSKTSSRATKLSSLTTNGLKIESPSVVLTGQLPITFSHC